MKDNIDSILIFSAPFLLFEYSWCTGIEKGFIDTANYLISGVNQ